MTRIAKGGRPDRRYGQRTEYTTKVCELCKSNFKLAIRDVARRRTCGVYCGNKLRGMLARGKKKSPWKRGPKAREIDAMRKKKDEVEQHLRTIFVGGYDEDTATPLSCRKEANGHPVIADEGEIL